MRPLVNLVAFGRATLIDDTGDVQTAQVTEGASGDGGADLVTDKVPRVAEFGFTSVPPLGSVVGLLRRAGDRGRSMIFGTSHIPSRPKGLKPGDTCLYDVRGAKVQLTKDGLLIDCAGLPAVIQNATTVTVKASGKVRVEATQIECTGDVVSRADGSPVSLNALRDAYVGHAHGKVQAGSAVSDLPDHKDV